MDERTLVYDVITQRWHERKSVVNAQDIRWRVNSLVTAYGRILVGDSQDGRIGRSEEHTSELQSHSDIVCRLLLEKKKNKKTSKS